MIYALHLRRPKRHPPKLTMDPSISALHRHRPKRYKDQVPSNLCYQVTENRVAYTTRQPIQSLLERSHLSREQRVLRYLSRKAPPRPRTHHLSPLGTHSVSVECQKWRLPRPRTSPTPTLPMIAWRSSLWLRRPRWSLAARMTSLYAASGSNWRSRGEQPHSWCLPCTCVTGWSPVPTSTSSPTGGGRHCLHRPHRRDRLERRTPPRLELATSRSAPLHPRPTCTLAGYGL